MTPADKLRTKKKHKDPMQLETWRHAALVAVLAWAGVGADSLSSANYGPEEAYKALHLSGHEPLVLWLALITALTVVVISLAYVQIIRLFPNGGGGYKAATRLVHPYAGLLSGSALVVDYSLTIAISVAAAADAMFNLVPLEWLQYKPFALAGGLGFLLFLNLRGIRESVTVLAPIVFGFLIIHIVLISFGLFARSDELVAAVVNAENHVASVTSEGGTWALVAVIATAYAAGAGTYTGIEALSENAQYLKPPRAQTGARAMALIALSLAVLAGGIMLLYTVWLPTIVEGRTLNAVVFEATLLKLFPDQELARQIILGVAMIFAATLLLVAASSGFLGGPAVLAWMSLDKWAPHSFAHLSNKLVAQNGVLAMGISAGALLLFTGGQVHSLVVLYSINVFLTFSLSNLAMLRFWAKHRAEHPGWPKHLFAHGLALLLCLTILGITVVEKLAEGGWVTIAVTSLLVALCFLIKRHYRKVVDALRQLDAELPSPPEVEDPGPAPSAPISSAAFSDGPTEGLREHHGARDPDPKKPVAILMVGGYSGLGRHALLTLLRMFPSHFGGVVFVSVAVVDSESFKGADQVEALERRTRESLLRYERYAASLGLAASSAFAVGTEVAVEVEKIAADLVVRYPKALFVAGQIIFEEDSVWNRVLHNETAFMVQKKLQRRAIPMIVVPVRLDLRARRVVTGARSDAVAAG